MFIRVGLYYGSSTAGQYKMSVPEGFDVLYYDEQTYEYEIAGHVSSNGGICRGNGSVVTATFDDGTSVSGETLYIAPTGFDDERRNTISVPSGKSFCGMLRFTSENARLSVINILRLEDYIKGVLPNEVVPSWEEECLKASAVAARSFVLSSIGGKHRSSGFEVCTTIHCQVYNGHGSEKESTNNAVDATASEIAAYDGKVIQAVYHSSSGGCTESAAGAWGGNESSYPYLTVVETPFEKYEEYPGGSWTYETTSKEVFEYINGKSAYKGKLRDDIVRIECTPGPSGYVRSVTLHDPYGNTLTVNTSSSVFSLFSKFVKSANFVITGSTDTKVCVNTPDNKVSVSSGLSVLTSRGTVALSDTSSLKVIRATGVDTVSATPSGERGEGGKIVFVGKGFGHGVGLSQYGSRELAKMGKTYDEILSTYYPGTYLTNISSVYGQ